MVILGIAFSRRFCRHLLSHTSALRVVHSSRSRWWWRWAHTHTSCSTGKRNRLSSEHFLLLFRLLWQFHEKLAYLGKEIHAMTDNFSFCAFSMAMPTIKKDDALSKQHETKWPWPTYHLHHVELIINLWCSIHILLAWKLLLQFEPMTIGWRFPLWSSFVCFPTNLLVFGLYLFIKDAIFLDF